MQKSFSELCEKESNACGPFWQIKVGIDEEDDDFDPWEMPELKDTETPWDGEFWSRVVIYGGWFHGTITK